MSIKIRAHHVMCIPRFKGVGYSLKFSKNMKKVQKEFLSGNYEIVDGCDDICAFCPKNINGICKENDKVSKYDKLVLEALNKGIKPEPKDICSDCGFYKTICSKMTV